MKWILIVLLIASVAVLGCTPTPKPAADPVPETAEEPSFDDAMATYQGGEWIVSYEQALAYAKETNRPILMNFTGSDWCSWCIKLAGEVFTKDAFLAYAKDNLVLLKLDFPRKNTQSVEEKAANDKLAQQFKITGYPTIILVGPDAKEIARTGYQPGGAEAYVKHLQDLLTPKK